MGEQRAQPIQIEGFGLDLAANVAAQHEIGYCFQAFRQRGASTLKEFEQRLVALDDQAEAALEVFARRGENIIEDAAQLVLKKRLERIGSLAEVAVDLANRFGKVGSLVGSLHIAEHGIVFLHGIKMAHTAR